MDLKTNGSRKVMEGDECSMMPSTARTTRGIISPNPLRVDWLIFDKEMELRRDATVTMFLLVTYR